MSTVVRFIEESPNMNYLLELGGMDFDFERKFIALVKSEFTTCLGNYLYHIKKSEPRSAAEEVYEIKFIFEMLGMANAFKFSEFHEEKLQMGNTELDEDFKKSLRKVNEYLKSF